MKIPFQSFDPEAVNSGALVDPRRRLWLVECRRAVELVRNGSLSSEEAFGGVDLERWFPDAAHRQIARLHLDVARHVCEYTTPIARQYRSGPHREGLHRIAQKFRLPTLHSRPLEGIDMPPADDTAVPLGLVMDLAEEIAARFAPSRRTGDVVAGQARPSVGSTAVPVLFLAGPTPDFDSEDPRRPAIGWMTLELIERGGGSFHAAPEHLFVACDQHWRAMERDIPIALARLGVWIGNADVRWRLVMRHPVIIQDDSFVLTGASAGAILGLGTATLFGGSNVWGRVDVIQTAFTAGLKADGSLFRVGGVEKKLAGAARSAEIFPRIGTVGLYKDDFSKISEEWVAMGGDFHRGPLNFVGPDILQEKGQEFFIIGAATLKEAAERIHAHRAARWPEGDGALDHIDPDLIARTDFDERIVSLVHGSGADRGALVIVAPAGHGKTTWMTGWLHNLRTDGRAPVYYIIRYQADVSRERIAQSLYLQLCRKHLIPVEAVPPVEAEKGSGTDWSSRLKALLPIVSSNLPRDEKGRVTKPEILFIEAADQTRQADTLLAGMLNPGLAPGIWCVFTTRQDHHWLTVKEGVRFIDFISGQELAPGEKRPTGFEAEKSYRHAIRSFLEDHGGRLDPPLRDGLIDEIVASETLPIFGTVTDTLRRLLPADGGEVRRLAIPGDLERCRNDVAPWLVEWEDRARQDADHLETSARLKLEVFKVDRPERLLWQALALFDLAHRPLSRKEVETLCAEAYFSASPDTTLPDRQKARETEAADDLNTLKGRLKSHLELLVNLARNFFSYHPFGGRDDDAYTFFHPAYARIVRDRLNSHRGAREQCQRLLGSGCRELLVDDHGRFLAHPEQQDSSTIRGYAFRYVVRHLAGVDGSGEGVVAVAPWRQLEDLLCGFPYLEARSKTGQIHDLLADWAEALALHPDQLADTRTRKAWVASFMQWLDAVKNRPLETECPPVPEVPPHSQTSTSAASAPDSQLDRLHQWMHFLASSGQAVTLLHARLDVLAYNYAADGSVHKAGRNSLNWS